MYFSYVWLCLSWFFVENRCELHCFLSIIIILLRLVLTNTCFQPTVGNLGNGGLDNMV